MDDLTIETKLELLEVELKYLGGELSEIKRDLDKLMTESGQWLIEFTEKIKAYREDQS